MSKLQICNLDDAGADVCSLFESQQMLVQVFEIKDGNIGMELHVGGKFE